MTNEERIALAVGRIRAALHAYDEALATGNLVAVPPARTAAKREVDRALNDILAGAQIGSRKPQPESVGVATTVTVGEDDGAVS